MARKTSPGRKKAPPVKKPFVVLASNCGSVSQLSYLAYEDGLCGEDDLCGEFVTLDDLFRDRNASGPHRVSPIWAPDDKRFAYTEGRNLMIFDIASKTRRELLSMSAVISFRERWP